MSITARHRIGSVRFRQMVGSLSLLVFWLMSAVSGVRAESLVSAYDLSAVAGPGSRYPHLFSSNGNVYLSWLQNSETATSSLWFSRLQGDVWSSATQVASGDNWFVNWADFPSVVALQDGTLAAHWLQKSAPDSYAYDVRLSFSADHGKSWGAPFSPHDDGTATEHGFVSLLPQPDNTLAAVWLDGRESSSADEKMQLRYARFDHQGKKVSEQLIDSDTCTCCQTSAVSVPEGIVVGYRDHLANEIRDIAVLRVQAGQAFAPKIVHADLWEIPGCPVNGPALASQGKQLAIAWYTGAQNVARVQLAISGDAGATFSKPARVDGGNPQGRVAVVMPTPHSAVVSWLERDGDVAALTLRRFNWNDTGLVVPGKPIVLAHLSLARASGFPRLALQQDRIVAAWTELNEGKPSRVRTMALALSGLPD